MLKPVAAGLALLALVATASARPKAEPTAPAPEDPGASDLGSRRKALDELLKEQWEYTLETNPVFASILGDKRWNDKLGDESLEGIKKDLETRRRVLARFETIDTTGFPEQEALNKDLMVLDLRNELAGERFEDWLMPVSQMSGIHIGAPRIATLLTFKTIKDYDDYIARLKRLPAVFDQNLERMQLGMRKGLTPPRFLLDKVARQAQDIGSRQPAQSPFAVPLSKMPEDVPEAEQKRIREQMLAAVRDQVTPAYQKFARFVAEQYAPKGRGEVGVWSLPDGRSRYARSVRLSTTTELGPEEIHQLGLREVTRIEGQMLAIATKLGHADVASFNKAIHENKELKAGSREQILELYRKHIDQMEKQLPKLFGRLPKAPLEVTPVEEFREKEAAAAYYVPPAPDGSRPGRVMVNTYKPGERSVMTMESTAYHEGYPGHHLQFAIQQELPELPPFRQHGGYDAFSEGWALYSERLGKEVGFFQDAYSDYGRLQDEMLRAIRLVVDTGLHFKRWSRDRVVQFFRDHSALDEIDVQNETDRYIVWPAQALSYKVGQLKILELRERAQSRLGSRFAVTEFHDQVLGAGALPLSVLEKRLDGWIAGKTASRAN